MKATAGNRPDRWICIDSNAVVQGPWHLESAAWRVLLYQSRTGLAHVILPDLVLQEIVGRFQEELEKRIREAAKPLDSLGRLVDLDFGVTDIDLDAAVGSYERDLRKTLSDSDVSIAPLPEVDVQDLAHRAIHRLRPFDSGGSGFRDALLWTLFLDLLVQNPDAEGILISKDGKAYWNEEKTGLHQALADEAASKGVRRPISIHESISGYFEKDAVGDPRLVAKVVDEIGRQNDALTRQLVEALTGATVRSDRSSVRAELQELTEPEVLLVRLAGTPSDEESGLLLVEFLVVSSARIQWWLRNEIEEGTRELESRLLTTATASFDQASGLFADLAVDPPSLSDCPELLAAVASLPATDAAYESTLEAIGRMSEAYTLPESTLEAIRNMPAVTLPESTLEAMRNMYTLPESTLEAMRNMFGNFSVPQTEDTGDQEGGDSGIHESDDPALSPDEEEGPFGDESDETPGN
jgi:PIN domain